jgi:hypothetical protein
MTRIHAPEPNSRQEQSVLFHSNTASRTGSGSMNALRAENLKLVEAVGWRRSGEIVCMLDGCYAPLEIWTRRKKRKPLERKYLERDTLVLHEHSNGPRSGDK